MKMMYGYVRVSTREQNEARQMRALYKIEVPRENIYMDKQSGKDFERPMYNRMVKRLQADDVIFVKSIDHPCGEVHIDTLGFQVGAFRPGHVGKGEDTSAVVEMLVKFSRFHRLLPHLYANAGRKSGAQHLRGTSLWPSSASRAICRYKFDAVHPQSTRGE